MSKSKDRGSGSTAKLKNKDKILKGQGSKCGEAIARLESDLSVARIEGNGQKVMALTKMIEYLKNKDSK